MGYPLAGMWAKVNRAMYHLEELNTETKDYLGPDTHPYSLAVNNYVKRGVSVGRLRIEREPDVRLGILAGEAVYQARSALDHIVYQLAYLNHPKPRGTQWPNAIDEARYREPDPETGESPRDRMLRNVREEHRAVVDEFQPYHDGARARDNLLYVLGRFANTDKHRVLQTAYGYPESIRVTPTTEDIPIDVHFPTDPGPLHDRAKLFVACRRATAPRTDRMGVSVDVKIRLLYGPADTLLVNWDMLRAFILRVIEIGQVFEERVPELRRT